MKWIIKNLYLLLALLVIPTLLSFTYNDELETEHIYIEGPVTVDEPVKIISEITKTVLENKKATGINVTITMYEPVPGQTDDTPNITADGTSFEIGAASTYKYVALSRNLLKRWGGAFNYGDYIIITGADGKNGTYQVKDTMNPRFKNYVDILETPGTAIYKFKNATIKKIKNQNSDYNTLNYNL